MFKLRSIRTALIAGALSLATAAAAGAADYNRDFTAHNYRNSTVVALFFKPVDYTDWTPMTGDRIAPDSWEQFTVTGFPGECEFDLEAKFADGSTSTGTFDLCAIENINV